MSQNKDKGKSETIFDRIKRVREELGLSQTVIAKRIGVTRSAVSQWESGQTQEISAANLRLLAKALNKSMEWLVDGGPEEGFLAHAPKRLCPILQSDEISEGWGDLNRKEDWMGFVDGPDNAGPRSFAIVVNGKSMEPEFQEGEIVVIDPEKIPKNNDFVVVIIEGRKKPVIRRFVKSDDRIYLECINPVYGEPPVLLKEIPAFIGRVIERKKLYPDD